MNLIREGRFRLRIEPHGRMRVPGIVFASDELLPDPRADLVLEQVINVATLPGIVRASYAMPDIHWGYGFPIGGVAATDVTAGGVVSPGGVGFDISCGVRLLASGIDRATLTPHLEAVMNALDHAIPRGMRGGEVWSLSGEPQLRRVLADGVRYALDCGHGVQRDLDRCEDGGVLPGADPIQISTRALERGLGQVGSLGSGNHFLEIQEVDHIYDDTTAAVFGLRPHQICVMIHCGSRGLGQPGVHRPREDHGRRHAALRDHDARPATRLHPRRLPGRPRLPVSHGRGDQLRPHQPPTARRSRPPDLPNPCAHRLYLVYDISHNLAGLETHTVDGRRRDLCVHRKGATRALPPGHPGLPADLRRTGQPVLIPGTMGTASHVLAGVPGGEAFHSTCHGAGRIQSRHAAARAIDGHRLRSELEDRGIAVRGTSWRGLAEEAPSAYKDVEQVVCAGVGAGLCRKVARLVPVGVVKG